MILTYLIQRETVKYLGVDVATFPPHPPPPPSYKKPLTSESVSLIPISYQKHIVIFLFKLVSLTDYWIHQSLKCLMQSWMELQGHTCPDLPGRISNMIF